MNPFSSTRTSFSTFVLIVICALQPSLRAATWYVDQTATGAGNGTSRADAWTSFAAINQAGLSGGDVVLVYPGTYNERFTTTQSGASANARIMYKGVGRPIVRGVRSGIAADTNYIALVGFEITHGSDSWGWEAIRLEGTTGWLIQDNIIHGLGFGRSGINLAINFINTHTIIRGNHIDLAALPGATLLGTHVSLAIGNNYNLVEYNTFERGSDRVANRGEYNVVRNNLMGRMHESDIPDVDPHIDDIQNLSSHVLFERNFSHQNDSGNAHLYSSRDLEDGGWNHVIVRHNIASQTGGIPVLIENYRDAYIYNNLFIDAQNQKAQAQKLDHAVVNTGAVTTAIWRNNSFVRSSNNSASTIILASGGATVTQDHNHSYVSGLVPGVGSMTDVNPLYTDEGSQNFSLTASSPLRGAGGAITQTVGAGVNSITLTVADAKPLFDGWTIVEADFIRIGTGDFVQIASINTDTNVVTLSAARSWNHGDPVIIRGMEDIGALPYDHAVPFALTNTTPINLPAGAVNLTATVSNPSAVRMMEFLVDGIPVGIDYVAPYSVAWTADGSPHSVEARAYSAWASETLFVSDFNTSLVFTAQPESQSVIAGATVIFAASVTASGTPSFQWQKNGVNLVNGGIVSGATTSTLTLTGVSLADAGTYSLVAQTLFSDPVSSAGSILVVNIPPAIVTQPVVQVVDLNGTASFSVAANGTPAPTYQWYRNGELIDGATESVYTIENVGPDNLGNYSVVVTNVADSMESDVVRLALRSAGNDINGDGSMDLLWQNRLTGHVYLWLMDGLARLPGGVDYGFHDINWVVAGIGDIDGDGQTDILWQNRATGHVYLWLMDGTTRRPGGVDYGFHAPEWVVAGVGDIDGDGHTDILWQNESTGHVYLWLMEGTTRRPGGVDYGFHEASWRVAGVGDLDGDGNNDILWQNNTTGHVFLWLMDGAVRRPGGIDYGFHAIDWKVAGVGDLNGDGHTDILWQNYATGHVYLWLMMSAVRVDGHDYGFHENNWRVAN